jgi:competence CoiA-like predicted nuclease
MKFALLNDKQRIEATKGAIGICPSCGSELVARCGEIKVHHWSHKKKCDDYSWENETEWHRNWKNEFPREWQEVIHKDESGEKHIADVKTDEDWVVEFQHSAIASEERNSRDKFSINLSFTNLD